MRLRELQHLFTDALDPKAEPGMRAAAGAAISAAGGLSAQQGLGVYRNNVSAAQVDALRRIFPVCLDVLGDACFSSMAYEYAWTHPSQHSDLNEYGAGFDAFLQAQIKRQANLTGYEYLPELARLERAWHLAWFSADAPVFDFDTFASASKNGGEDLYLHVNPSLTLMICEYPVAEIWLRHRAKEAPAEVCALQTPDHLAIVRVRTEVNLVPVSEATYRLLTACKQGKTLGELAADAQLAAALSALGDLIARGLICDFGSAKAVGHV